ncbi:BMP family ABC transporter substrate-binding protein [Mycoplasma sp. 653B]|uniref:BMP family ABC transporter substrate-binding protein n=1 Tax=Mycoplasma sp. 653B TaxID=3401677 RepID=UPI003AAF51CC
MKKIKSLLIAFAGISVATLPIVAGACNGDKTAGTTTGGTTTPGTTTGGTTTGGTTTGGTTTPGTTTPGTTTPGTTTPGTTTGTTGKQAKYIAPENRVTKGVIKLNDQLADKIKNLKSIPSIAFVTESGGILDQSFNQSGWEGLLDLSDQFKAAGKTLIAKPIEPAVGNSLVDQYNSLLDSKTQIWILSGYAHGDYLPDFINQNSARLIANNVKIIGLDYAIKPEQIKVPFKDLYTITYKVQGPSYVVGQAIADYLNKYSTKNKTTTTFGGGDYDGVTAFMNGYVKGIYSYDKAHADAKIKVLTSGSNGKLEIDSGFESDPKMNSAITQAVATKAKVILPVAGTATAILKTQLEQSNAEGTVIIGVDADQSKAFPSAQGLFITSITKNLGQSVYDSLLYTIFGLNNSTKTFNASATTVQTLSGTLENNWVGYAQSTLSNKEQRDYVNQQLAAYKSQLLSADKTTKDYVYTDSTMPGQAAQPNVNGVNVADAVVKLINALAK